MHKARHAMASSTRSEVLVCCGISVVKKRNTTSVVRDYFGLRANPDGSVVRGKANYLMCRSCGNSVPAKGGNITKSCIADHHCAHLTPKNMDKLECF